MKQTIIDNRNRAVRVEDRQQTKQALRELQLRIKPAIDDVISWSPLELNCGQQGHRWIPRAGEWEICATCGVSRSIAHRR